MDATQSGMCETCFKNNIDISEGITKQGLIHYCRQCDRYLKTGWIRCSLESSDMMTLCLGKVKGLNKSVKILDSSFVWTEPHSKRIKVKLSIQKEVLNGVVVQKTFIVEFVVEWIQCDDCKKTFTPHIWNAACQIRQKVNHKRTFLLMEQLIMKHQMHSKAVNIKEMPEGIDFYFQNKSQANSLSDFITVKEN
jgi:nonsense-mediated mRNA decay protein 3